MLNLWIRCFLLLLFILDPSLGNTRAKHISPDPSLEARNLHTKVYNIYSRAQNHRDKNSLLYRDVTMTKLCTSAHIGGVCGENNDGFHKGGNYSYSVASNSDGQKIIITVRGIKSDKVGKLAKQYIVSNNSKCSNATYQAGVLTVTCDAPQNLLLLCNLRCSNTTSDLSGQAFLACLENQFCTSIGITKDNDLPSSNLTSLFEPSVLDAYSHLKTGNTILTNLAACHLNVAAAGTNNTACISAVNGYCGNSGITMDNIMTKVGTFSFLGNCFETNQFSEHSTHSTPTVSGCTLAYGTVQNDNSIYGISVNFFDIIPNCDGFVATAAQCTAACSGISSGDVDVHMLTNSGASSDSTPTNYEMCLYSDCSFCAPTPLLPCITKLKLVDYNGYTYDSCDTAATTCNSVSGSLTGDYLAIYNNCATFLTAEGGSCHTSCLFDSNYNGQTMPSNPVTSTNITDVINSLEVEAALHHSYDNTAGEAAANAAIIELTDVCYKCSRCYQTSGAGDGMQLGGQTIYLSDTQKTNYLSCVAAGYYTGAP